MPATRQKRRCEGRFQNARYCDIELCKRLLVNDINAICEIENVAYSTRDLVGQGDLSPQRCQRDRSPQLFAEVTLIRSVDAYAGGIISTLRQRYCRTESCRGREFARQNFAGATRHLLPPECNSAGERNFLASSQPLQVGRAIFL
jgi:hypothetical protein